jgi:hypothetical protein
MIALLVLALAAAHHPGVTYLDCNTDGSSVHSLTTINEPQGVVTFQDARGFHEVPAQFAADAVYFPGTLDAMIKLSRVDLSMRINGMKVSQCHIARTPKRAF